MKLLKRIACIGLPLVLLSACTNETSVNSSNSVAVNAARTPANNASSTPADEAALDPKKLYTKNCAACHRPSGEGGKMEFEGKTINPDNLTSAKAKKLSDDKIANIVKEGVEDDGMPSFKDKLTDEQINAIISYIRSDLQKVPAS